MLFVLLFAAPLVAQDTRFTVVIDAGHGGHDPGAMGAISREKDINLVIALDLGAIIEQKYKDVKVVYTRKTDRYLTLQERADVVNNNHADLFICVHTNSAKSSAAFGAETFTLGVNNSRTKGNLEVAMRENSVITLEENYITKYQGFDPNSVDSYIMFEFMQNKYIDRSVEFASTIQKQFRNYCKRFDRGVQQESFWVLYRSACPSVLIEVGFISNSAEERYLNSESGQNEIASGIFNAFVDYKREHDKKSGKHISSVSKIDRPAKSEDISKSNKKHEVSDTTQPEPTTKLIAQAQSQIDTTPQIQPKYQAQVVVPVESKKEKEVDLGGVFKASSDIKKENISTTPVFKVQLIASAKPLKPNSPEFKGMKNIDSFTEGGMIKYTVGAETDYSKIEKIRLDIHKKFPDAFIVAFVGNKKISAKEGLKLMK
jgi:N-acetylmuramoyl-L-alanine amidase